MSPPEVSTALRLIAARVDLSVRPSRSAVAAELKRVLARMASRRKKKVGDGVCAKCDRPGDYCDCEGGPFLNQRSVFDKRGEVFNCAECGLTSDHCECFGGPVEPTAKTPIRP
jgi:hypothetical protein